jgi:microcystin-dependent protein
MFGDMCVGSVTGFAGQVSPVSSDANNRWKATACGSDQATSGKRRDDVPLNYIESAGWMLCDGRTLPTVSYPELFAVLGYLYGGSGDQFCIPDYRGLFLRGTDAGSGMDPDASKRIGPTGQGQDSGIGSYQCDAMQTHTHTYSAVTLAAVSQSGNAAGQASGDLQTSAPTAPARITTETRPKNIAINYIIKFR